MPGTLVMCRGDALDATREAPTMTDIHSTFAQQGLVRPQQQRVLGGVCAGLGRRLGIGPWTARLLFVLLLMVIPGSQILIYPILWILMPSEHAAPYGSSGYPPPSA
jgi:phage shock protein C